MPTEDVPFVLAQPANLFQGDGFVPGRGKIGSEGMSQIEDTLKGTAREEGRGLGGSGREDCGTSGQGERAQSRPPGNRFTQLDDACRQAHWRNYWRTTWFGVDRSLILSYGLADAFELGEGEIFQKAGFWVERPVERADSTLMVAGANPVDELLIGELVGIALAVIDIAAKDFTVPEEALLGGQASRDEACQILFGPSVAAGKVVDAFADAGLFIATVAEGDQGSGVGGPDDGLDGQPIVRGRLVGVGLHPVEPPAADLSLITVGILL